jgi:hypothetical protein
MRFLLVVGILLAAMFPNLAQAERVSVREGVLRISPSPFGAIKGKIPYDTEVRVDQRQDAWVHISQPDPGWLHVSSLSASRNASLLTPGARGPAPSVSDNEVSLAGKGFDRNIENAYRASHGSLRYDLIDRVERITVEEDEVGRFVNVGSGRGQ